MKKKTIRKKQVKRKTKPDRRELELLRLIEVHEKRIHEAELRNVALLDMLRNSEEARTVLARWVNGLDG